VLESTGTLDDLCRHLEPCGCFLRPHRSYLINLDYIQSLSYRAITMSCLTEIPLPRGKYHEIKEAYMDRAFQNKQVLV
jgi:DNA-binding LytR/AlgR family response regulator